MEDIFGTYRSIRGSHDIQFTLDETGMASFVLDDLEYDTETLTYCYPARYGGAQLLFIDFYDNAGYGNSLKIFIVSADRDFILATGYYLRSKWDGNQLIIKDRGTFDLEYQSAWE
ncbi:hypothetical protein CHISP_3230 [Chitinispirillum alkaliphilum]|nr:hypothetical protein CHISP_3230 [Chitinispirillum alkaliphilum]